MWRAVDDGGQLQYGNFMDTVLQLMPFYWIRLVGGTLYLTGMLMCGFNILKTISAAPAPAVAPAAAK